MGDFNIETMISHGKKIPGNISFIVKQWSCKKGQLVDAPLPMDDMRSPGSYLTFPDQIAIKCVQDIHASQKVDVFNDTSWTFYLGYRYMIVGRLP